MQQVYISFYKIGLGKGITLGFVDIGLRGFGVRSRGSGFDGVGLGGRVLGQRGRSCRIRAPGELGVREGELVVQGLGVRGEVLGVLEVYLSYPGRS